MPTTLTIENDGFAEVSIGESTHRVDLYSAYNRLLTSGAQVREQHGAGEESAAAQNHAYLGAVCAYLAELGFADVGHKAAGKFEEWLFATVEEQKKTDEPTPA